MIFPNSPNSVTVFSLLRLIPLTTVFALIAAISARAAEQRSVPVQSSYRQQYAQTSIPQQQPEESDTLRPGGVDQPGGPDGPGGPGGKVGWSLAVGGVVMFGPAYEGSDKYSVMPLPDFSVEYNDGLFFAKLLGGIGSYPIKGENYKVGASISLAFGRQEKDDRKNLRGMGDIDLGATANLMAECGIGPVQISGKVSRGSGDYGTTAEVELSRMYFINQRFIMMVSAGTTWVDAEHMNTYFGVSTAQSARSGYSRYEAESGFKSVGFGVGAFYSVTNHIDVMFMVKADQLLGDADDSPLTREKFQPATFMSMSYKF